MIGLYVYLLELGNMYGWIELNVLNKIGKWFHVFNSNCEHEMEYMYRNPEKVTHSGFNENKDHYVQMNCFRVSFGNCVRMEIVRGM